MLLSDIAEKYIAFNVYNPATATITRIACDLFDRRSGISDIRTLEPAHIENFRRETLAKACVITYNGYLAHINVVASWGEQEGYCQAKYIRLVRRAPEPKIAPKTIPAEDLRTVLQQLRAKPAMVPDAWFWMIAIRFFSGTGLRRRQLVELQYRDINWDRKLLTLRYEASKNYRSWSVPLMDWLLDDFKILIAAIESALGRPIREHDRLFNICYFNPRCQPDRDDPTKMKATYISHTMMRIAERSGVVISAHKLRHTLATHLCNPVDPDDSPDIFFTQHILGHTDIRSTRLYVQTRVEHRHAYMAKLLRDIGPGVDISEPDDASPV